MIKLGTLTPNKFYLGSIEVSKIYLGSTVIYDPEITMYTLTVEITGLPEEYEVAFNDEIWVNNEKSFPIGTILDNIVPSAIGYTFTPSSRGPITMDSDKTISFAATATAPSENYMVGFTPLILNNGQFDAGKPLTDLGDGIWSTTFDASYFITSYLSTTDSEFGVKLQAGDKFKLGFGYDDIFETNALMWDGSVLSLQLGGDNTAVTPQPVVGDFIRIKSTGTAINGFGAQVFIGEDDSTPITGEINSLYSYQVYIAGSIDGFNSTMSYPQGKNLTIVPL